MLALPTLRVKGQKKLPDARGVADARASLAEAECQRSAADDARQRGAEIVVETLKQHRAVYVRAAEDAVDSARIDEAAALTAYLGAVERSTVAGETLAWLQGFPEKRNYRPNTTYVRHVGRLEPISFSDLVLRTQGAVRPRRASASDARRARPRSRASSGDRWRRDAVSSIDDAIRRAAGRRQLFPSGRPVSQQPEGLDGGSHAPHQPEPIDMDKVIRARTGNGPQPNGYAPNGIALRVE